MNTSTMQNICFQANHTNSIIRLRSERARLLNESKEYREKMNALERKVSSLAEGKASLI